MAKGTTPASDRSTHRWTPQELSWIAERPTMPRTEFLEQFAKAFPETAAKVSSQAPIGRRYRLLKDGSKAHPEIGLSAINARIAELEDELADLMDRRSRMESATPDIPSVEEITALPMNEVRALADRVGVKKSGGKQAIAERIHAQTA